MSLEVCPFCGKTYKRLKSHLPHCKAAASARTPPTTQDVTVLSKTTTKENTPKPLTPMATDRPPKRSKKDSAQLATAADGSSSRLASTIIPSKKKQKTRTQTLVDQFRATAPSTPPCLRALIEEAKPDHIVKGTGSGSEDPSLSRTSRQSKTEPAAESFEAAGVFSGTKANKQPTMKDFTSTTLLDSKVNPDQSGHRVKATLQDVKSTLGRASSRRPSSILSRITAADEIKLHNDPSSVPLPAENQKHQTAQPQKQLSTNQSPPSELQLSGNKSGPPASIQHLLLPASAAQGGRSRLGVSEPGRSLPSVAAATDQPSSHVQRLLTEGSTTQQHVGQVRLKELPDWLLSRRPSRPADVLEMVQRGWLWYYRRYIDVRRGGVGGLSMLLAGYCVLSYAWSYPHIKLSRWRKYH